MHFCVWLLLINITSVRTIRAVSGSSWFTLLVKGIPVLDVLRFLICFPADGLLGVLQFGLLSVVLL